MRVSRMFSTDLAEFGMGGVGALILHRLTCHQLQLAFSFNDTRHDSDDAAQLAVGWALMFIIACIVGVAGYRISRTDLTTARGWRSGAWAFISALLVWSITVYWGSQEPRAVETFCISLVAIAFTTLTSIVPSTLARATTAA